MASTDVRKAARDKKFSHRTLHRAKDAVGVVVESAGFPRTTTWRLPSRASDTTEQDRGTTGDRGTTITGQGITGAGSDLERQSCHLGTYGTTGGIDDLGAWCSDADGIADKLGVTPRVDIIPVADEFGATVVEVVDHQAAHDRARDAAAEAFE
jgi:hypothetical protein